MSDHDRAWDNDQSFRRTVGTRPNEPKTTPDQVRDLLRESASRLQGEAGR